MPDSILHRINNILLTKISSSQCSEFLTATGNEQLQLEVAIEILTTKQRSELIHLDLFNMKVFDLRSLTDLPELKSICLRGTEVTDLSPLSNCYKLEVIDLSFTKVNNISPLSNCYELRILNLLKTKVKYIEPLRSCNKLTALRIDNPRFDNKGRADLFTKNNELFNFFLISYACLDDAKRQKKSIAI